MSKAKPKPTPKPLGRPRKPHQYVSINLNVTPEDAAWLRVSGNASHKAREAFKAARERE